MKMTILLTLILSIFAVSACQTASTETASNVPTNAAQNEIKQISVEQAKNVVDAKDVQFIDVRTSGEYVGRHAPKAINFPLDALEKDLAKLDKDRPVYVICQTGRRSQKGAEILQKAGFNDIYNIQGGTSAWIEAKLPIEKN
ncbi:MAG TPA: rhodanese-like domain-containing protein [Pyrinomonadaceae bacterium]|nr:rhodanese-like domain-containing protein [Pyrinomonadaceae bacterium]